MKRAKGTTLAEIIEAMGRQKDAVRGFVSILGTQKRALTVDNSQLGLGHNRQLASGTLFNAHKTQARTSLTLEFSTAARIGCFWRQLSRFT